MSNRKQKNNFSSHNFPLLVGMVLSTLALVLSIPVTMIGLTQQQSGEGLAKESLTNRVSAKKDGVSGFATYNDENKCVFCPNNARTFIKCAQVEDNWCGNLPKPKLLNKVVNDDDPAIEYLGPWDYQKDYAVLAYKSDYHATPNNAKQGRTTIPQGSARLNFVGNKVSASFLTWVNRGIADIYVDGQKMASLDGYHAQVLRKSWTSEELSCGQHTIEIKHTGKTTAPQKGTYVVLDFFSYTPCDANSTGTPTSTPTTTTKTPTPTNISQSLLTGDLNVDKKVDIFDLNLVLSNFGKTNCPEDGDADNNCVVDIFDYNLILKNFGRTK